MASTAPTAAAGSSMEAAVRSPPRRQGDLMNRILEARLIGPQIKYFRVVKKQIITYQRPLKDGKKYITYILVGMKYLVNVKRQLQIYTSDDFS